MRAVDIIAAKRDGTELSARQQAFLMDGFLSGKVPDYQMASFLMAVFFQGMTENETLNLTVLMRDSGKTISREGLDKFIVDKHSTGGVGDKVTIVLAPILAALGMATVKISGKGLGHTGGTIDKFESIPNFAFSQTPAQLAAIASKTGIGLMGQSESIVPLDKKLYALRDVTATVGSIPLIAASVMSKKLAVSSNLIILDVKVGDGAFMKDIDSATKLARSMIAIGKGLGRQVRVILSNMDEPLGHAVGNACEMAEALACLGGDFPPDLKTVVYTIAGLALRDRGDIKYLEEAAPLIDAVVNSGAALAALRLFVAESGGRAEVIDNPALLPQTRYRAVAASPADGYVSRIKAEEIGIAAMLLGAGRPTKEAQIDHSAGISCLRKIGDFVPRGSPLAELFYNNDSSLAEAQRLVQGAYGLSPAPVLKQMPVLKIIE